MALLPEQFVNQVQQATDIVELVGQFVSIAKRGKDYVGLCPFHKEKTPSFYVSPAKQMFKCFGCGAGGGAYQFVILHQKVTFPEAVRFLAERAGIRMPEPSNQGPAEQAGLDRAEMGRLMRFALEFYQRQLRVTAGAAALTYVRQRGLADQSIERFELGYAPDAWDGLIQAARREGLGGEQQLLAAGLVVRSERGTCYDRFRNRLMFPIIDAAGRVIAFGGRALAAEEKAKYLNSPETILFDKSSNLYGLNWARQAIGQAGQVVVVEGYFDVLLPVQAGVENVVATLGTALTDRHVRTLSRLASDLVLVFDADAAGVAAAERGLELFAAQQVNVRIATIPEGKDPADYVLAHGGEAFAQLIRQAPEALEHLWRRREAEFAGKSDLLAKRRAAEEFLRVVVTGAAYGAIDAVRQGLLVNRLAHLLDIPAEQLQGQIRLILRRIPTAASARPAVGSGVQAPEPPAGPAAAQRRILEVLMCEPDLFDLAARQVGPDDFTDPSLAPLAGEVWRLGEAGQLGAEALLAVQMGAEWGRLVTDLLVAGQARGNHALTLAGDLELMARRAERDTLDQLRRCGDDQSLRELTELLKKPDVRRRPW